MGLGGRLTAEGRGLLTAPRVGLVDERACADGQMRARPRQRADLRPSGYSRGIDVLELIDRLDGLLSEARALPFTDQVRLEREAVFGVLDEIRATVPEEVRQARWIVKERQQMLAETARECELLLEQARAQAALECSPLRLTPLAERQAEEIQQQARRQAHELRAEVDAWADAILAA